jgi:cell division topological specificity factor
VLDFLKTLFKPATPSGATAKERLRLVLLSDHLSLAPEMVEALKRDLIAVISRYVEIDPEQADVTFEHREHEVAMLASIPITGVRERGTPVSAPVPVVLAAAVAIPEAAEAGETVPIEAEAARHDVPGEPEAAHVASEGPPADPEAAPVEPGASAQPGRVPVRASNGAAPRRRRRRKKAGTLPAQAAMPLGQAGASPMPG